MDENSINVDLDVMNLITANRNDDNNFLYLRYSRKEKTSFIKTKLNTDLLLNALGSVLCSKDEEFVEDFADAVLKLSVYILSKKPEAIREEFIKAMKEV